jgi:hypothetical protein
MTNSERERHEDALAHANAVSGLDDSIADALDRIAQTRSPVTRREAVPATGEITSRACPEHGGGPCECVGSLPYEKTVPVALEIPDSFGAMGRALADHVNELWRQMFKAMQLEEAMMGIPMTSKQITEAVERLEQNSTAIHGTSIEKLVELAKTNPWPLRYHVHDRGAIIDACWEEVKRYEDQARHCAVESMRATLAGNHDEARVLWNNGLFAMLVATRYQNVGTALLPNKHEERVAPFECEAREAFDKVWDGDALNREFEYVVLSRAQNDLDVVRGANAMSRAGADMSAVDLCEFRMLPETTQKEWLKKWNDKFAP